MRWNVEGRALILGLSTTRVQSLCVPNHFRSLPCQHTCVESSAPHRGLLHQPSRVNAAGNEHIFRRLIRTGVRKKIHGSTFKVSAVSHSPHRWLIGHDMPQVRHSVAQVKSHVGHRIPASVSRSLHA